MYLLFFITATISFLLFCLVQPKTGYDRTIDDSEQEAFLKKVNEKAVDR